MENYLSVIGLATDTPFNFKGTHMHKYVAPVLAGALAIFLGNVAYAAYVKNSTAG